MLTGLKIKQGHHTPIPADGGLPDQVHVFDQASIDAVNAAMAARRPLLVRGEPGTGKSQLAHAVAIELGRPLVSKVIDARTAPRDLLYEFDAVARLARAQVIGSLPQEERNLKDLLDERHFLRPGPLWWAFEWTRAAQELQAQTPHHAADWSPKQGTVILIDEIDKADSDVPNGLLEALGAGRFSAPGFPVPIRMQQDAPCLIILTTNEERSLPDAFLRRCLVLKLALPDESQEKLVQFLSERAEAHFPRLAETVRRRAAQLLIEDRADARGRGLSPPGQAEYLDLLRAVGELGGNAKQQVDLLERLRGYVYRKHPQDAGR